MAVALVCLYFTGDEFCFQGAFAIPAALGEVLHVCPGLLDDVWKGAGPLTQSFEHPWGMSADTPGLLQLAHGGEVFSPMWHVRGSKAAAAF